MNEGRWLDGATSGPEAELRAGLDDARARLPDEVAMRRLWGKVEKIAAPERRRSGRPRWTWFAGGVISSAALALGLAFAFWPVRSGVKLDAVFAAPVTAVPTAKTAPPRSARAPMPTATPIAMPSRTLAAGAARTGPADTLRVVLPGGAEAHLAQSSALAVEPRTKSDTKSASDDGIHPRVERGEVMFDVPHQPPGRTFSVLAGPYRIVVVGTKFRVHVQGDAVGVDVEEGVVEVWKRRRLARLVPGDSWASPDARPWRTVAAAGPRGGRSAVADVVAVPARSPAVTGTADELPVSASGSAPRASGPVTAQEARAALAAGEPRRALDAYRAIAARGGSAAENAEYEIGRILRDRLGEPEGAIAAWRRYRSSHPDGLLRIETDVSIIETLASSGDATGALAEASDFLRRHPDSERRAEIARVAGDLYRARGDCSHALAAYQTALSAPRSRDIADYASFHRAACLVNLGESSGNDALEGYLRAWPSGRFRGDATRLLRRLDEHNGSP
jgi:hypothetical protein